MTTTATIPTGTRTAVLADLRQRRDKAETLIYAAEDAGQQEKWRKATARMWLRELQMHYLELTPGDGACPTCLWGTESWPVQGLFDAPVLWSCLEHWTPALERQAAEMAEQARWFGPAPAPARRA